MENVNLYQEMNDKIAELLLGCEDSAMCLYAGHYIKSLEGQLKGYKDLEEQNRVPKLPCAVGDTVYVIPSETNYKLNIINGHSENNRVYEQVVNRIEISKSSYLLLTCDGMASVIDKFYKETWFLTKEEAEAALKMKLVSMGGG